MEAIGRRTAPDFTRHMPVNIRARSQMRDTPGASTPPRHQRPLRPQTTTPRPATAGSAWKSAAQKYTNSDAQSPSGMSALDYTKYLEHRKKMIQLKVTLTHNGRPNSSSKPWRVTGGRPTSGLPSDRMPRRGVAMPGGLVSRTGWTTTSPQKEKDLAIPLPVPIPNSVLAMPDAYRVPRPGTQEGRRQQALPSQPEIVVPDEYQNLPPRPNTVSGTRPRPPTERCLENYTIGKALGAGAYAQVYFARHLGSSTCQDCAIKVYEKCKLSDVSRRRGVLREIKILSRVNHPNIISFYEALDRTSKIFLVMEYCSGGSLFSLLKKMEGRCCEENHAKRLFHETALGLKYLHDRSIVHRDIKLENILLDEHDSIKIIDFGFATVVAPGKKLKAFCGTPSYMAPEIVARKEYIPRAPDVWAMGVLFFAMLAGHFPFKGANDRELYRKVLKGAYQIPARASAGSREAISKMLEVDQVRRASINDILALDHFEFECERKTSRSLHDSSTASTHTGCPPSIRQSSKETIVASVPSEAPSVKVQEEAIVKLERLGYSRGEIVEQLADETSHLSRLYYRFLKALNAWDK